MIFLSFPDHHPTVTPAQLAADHFPATTRFFQRASYGKFLLRPHPLRQWIRMPRPSDWYGMRRDWDSERRAAYLRDAINVIDPKVDFSRFDIVYLVADPDAPGVDSDATKVVNFNRPLRLDGADVRRVVTVFEQHPPDRNVLAHETGHVLDLPDLYHRPADNKGDWDTYVGDWDVMGSQFGLAAVFFGWHKWKLGWLEREQVICVQRTQDITLEPIAAAPAPAAGAPGTPGTPGGTRLAVIRTGESSAVAIEARSATGNDRATCTEGVLLYRVRNATPSGGGPIDVIDTHPRTQACRGRSVYPPLADAPLRVGEAFTIPGAHARVEVTGRKPSGAWTVRITTGRQHRPVRAGPGLEAKGPHGSA